MKQAHIYGGDVIDGNNAEEIRKVIAEQAWK